MENENVMADKINDGSPFGIIFIAGNSDNPIDIDDKTKKIESCFRADESNWFIDYPITIEDYLILDNLKSCFVFQNEPNVTLFDNDDNDRPFNLKQYLLGLKEKLGFEPIGIFYCENANTHKIELIGNDSDFREILLEFSENIPKAPNELPQFLTNFKNSKIPNEKISFSPPKNYPSIFYIKYKREVRNTFDRYFWHGYSKIPQEKRIAKIKEQVKEEIKINPFFCNHRVSSEQNRKINEIAEGLKSGKIIGEKIISNAFDLNASYCFITPDGLKNLKERLFIDIINAINQKKRVALDHAQNNTFHFIFDIGNPLLKESSQLVIEVPREALDLENVDELVKSILLLNNNLKSHVSEGKLLPNNNLKCYISEGSYIIDLHLIDD
ncbi:hypothetical protein MPF98_03920 [Helicobacter pylori]|uniref:hypothetical protein n=1 Tax=Helicobacter pylori TaxID=210 RepID=UPI001FCF961F|nr:hypothetical protein [Helicobacter pylori]UOS48777.1 hypothetical protein MPF98_03920 [Helicobacter pylori]